ncbi:M35 family metallo-endopeptidase [Pseudoroseicyclus sp. H15]
MSLRFLIGATMALFLPAAALAATFERCAKTEIAVAEEAFAGAGAIVLAAAASVRDSDQFTRWFGYYSVSRGETVRRNLKAINRALISDNMVGICPSLGEDGCLRDTYANVFPDEPYVINLCPAFFDQPNMTDHRPGDPELDNGTREGTIIHEMSHFRVVADTEDLCYSRIHCSGMARRDPAGAIRNADSYQYFAEDVTFFPAPLPEELLGGQQMPSPIDRTLPMRAERTPGCLTCRDTGQ